MEYILLLSISTQYSNKSNPPGFHFKYILFLKDLKAHLDFVPHEAMLGLPPLLDAQTSMVYTTRDTQRGQGGGHTLSLFPRGAVHNRGPFKLIIPPEIADSK